MYFGLFVSFGIPVVTLSAGGGMAGDTLTPRELEILHMMAQGLSNQEIADALSISLNTLETHMRHIHSKLKLKSRSKVLLWYMDNKAKEDEK